MSHEHSRKGTPFVYSWGVVPMLVVSICSPARPLPSPADGVEYLPVGTLDLVPEESEAAPSASPAMRIPRGGSHGSFLTNVASLGAPTARDLLSGSGSLNAFRTDGGSNSGGWGACTGG
jgi:hypothetical protein